MGRVSHIPPIAPNVKLTESSSEPQISVEGWVDVELADGSAGSDGDPDDTDRD